MKWLGLGILAQAQKNAFYWDSCDTLQRSVFAVLQAAHSAEILIKAAIAQEHPLLIFSQIPKSSSTDDGLLGISDLLHQGKSIQYSELPERLWAVTGYKINELKTYQDFGKVRNIIQHVALPSSEFNQLTAEFIYKVIDPLIGDLWDFFAVEHCDVDSHEDDMFNILVRYGITYFRYPSRFSSQAEQALAGNEN
ncbi:MAG: hypothetical protein KME25_06555 [Symplocastrum torsivum CPER-KK1]|jgi:hypothetical protein|uniref:Uncharacterized protein n=1 Tax=Symplocastrum torsivum CPER-KK1 TaxID=450513 RepID=A0A951PK49_9CYAN|nr:hypothetical protein [Symplocastrum torsivum CPER-KK1]